MKVKLLVVFVFLLFNGVCFSQDVTNVNTVKPTEEYDNVHYKKFYSDMNTSYFVIWIKKGIRSHKHVSHTENVIVLEGSGVMTVGEKTFDIKVGDYFMIHQDVFHAVEVTSEEPLKIIAVRSPEYFGKDIVFEDEQKGEY
ncbi:MAG: cupin domain-containing protein [Vicingus serpentipes]|nr:cupin domain-containing protein [Vicingus serpentipes]